MAEGGIKVVDGSEPVFDHACTHLAHSCRQEAVKSCKECKTLLCQDCLIHHERNMKAHTLVYIESLSKSQITNIGKKSTMLKCPNHPDRDIEMYCGSHDMVYCSLCVAKNHRSCKGVKELQDVPHNTNLSLLQKLVADLTNVNKRLQETKLAQKRRVKELKSVKVSILKEIKSLRKRMNDHLDVLEDQLIAECDAEQRSLEDETKAEVKETESIIKVIEQQKQDMTANYDPTQMFTVGKLINAALNDAERFLNKAAIAKQQTLVFEHNAELLDAIEGTDRIGKLTRCDINLKGTQPGPYGAKSRKFIMRKGFEHVFTIKDMCQLSDGTLLLIESWNFLYIFNKLSRINDDDKADVIYGFNVSPKAICPVSPTEVALLLENKTIQIIDVRRSLFRSLTCQREINLSFKDKSMNGMAYCSNRFWILGDNAIYVFTSSVSFPKTIERDTHGEKIFKVTNPRGITVSNDDSMVFVAAGDDRVVVFNMHGDYVREFRDERLDGTYGICITCDDIVLVSVYLSGNVLMFDLEGECLGELISNEHLLDNPRSICFDNQKRRLLVSFWYSNKIACFDLDQ